MQEIGKCRKGIRKQSLMQKIWRSVAHNQHLFFSLREGVHFSEGQHLTSKFILCCVRDTVSLSQYTKVHVMNVHVYRGQGTVPSLPVICHQDKLDCVGSVLARQNSLFFWYKQTGNGQIFKRKVSYHHHDCNGYF